jgi:hypothetical protein
VVKIRAALLLVLTACVTCSVVLYARMVWAGEGAIMSEDNVIVAIVAALLGLGGGGYGGKLLQRSRDTDRDDNAIRREAKMEMAIDNLVKSTETLLAHVESLRTDRHKHAQTLQYHEGRIAKIENDLAGTSNRIHVGAPG